MKQKNIILKCRLLVRTVRKQIKNLKNKAEITVDKKLSENLRRVRRLKGVDLQSVCFFSTTFQGLFVSGVGDVVTEASVATDSSLPRHVADRYQPRSVGSTVVSVVTGSPLCISITPSLFHSQLKTYLFHKFYLPSPRSFTSFSQTASTEPSK